jgi:hypothetical protein
MGLAMWELGRVICATSKQAVRLWPLPFHPAPFPPGPLLDLLTDRRQRCPAQRWQDVAPASPMCTRACVVHLDLGHRF